MDEQPIEGFRLSPQQRRLWRLQELDDRNSYFAQTAILIEGVLQPETLRAAVQETVNRHEILHTTFSSLPEMETALQVIGPSRFQWLQSRRLTDADPDELRTQLEMLLDEARQHPFDLENGPLFRVSLFELAGERHLLLLTLPALLSDTVTLSKLATEIGNAYAALLRGEEYAAEAIQYADLSEWQNELLESEEINPGKEFWRREALHANRFVEFPTGTGDFEQADDNLRRLETSIPAPLVAGLEELAASLECSVEAVLFACWQTLLRRLTGETEVTCRVAFDGRRYAETENALGLCARYAPVRSLLDKRLSFAASVKAVEENLQEVGERQEYFIETVDSPPRDEKPNGLRIGFEYLAWPQPIHAANLTLSFWTLSSLFDRFDLKLSCSHKQKTMLASVHYDARSLQPDAAARLAQNFQTLLADAIARPHHPISGLEILGEAERARLLHEFNDTARDRLSDPCVHELFEEQAAKTPDATALVFKHERLSYRELNERAERLARRLRAEGVVPETLVGLCVERSVEMVVGILGILKSGGAYLPLDPSYPEERLAFMLADTRVPVLLTQSRLLEKLSAHTPLVICLDKESEKIENDADQEEAVHRALVPDYAAYVIYTSGSTGKPKGVVVTHRNLCHSTAARACYYNKPPARFLLTSSFAFDSSVAGIFWTLCYGGTLFLPEEGMQRDVARLAELIDEQNISHLLTLPSLYALLLEHAQSAQLDFPTTFIVAGEACPKELLKRHREILPRAELFNEYGPTESTVWSTVYDCVQAHLPNTRVPIGRPIMNTQIYLLDAELEPVPLGFTGEMYIGGDGLTRGYLNNPALTAERFIPDGVSRRAGARLYRTGDVARYLPDGNLEFLGRNDEQVKLRGYRIELREIESVLEQHTGVEQAVVLAREDSPGNQRLVAYVVTSPHDSAPTTDELRDFTADKLPDYMIPSVFVLLDALPSMPNGKVDRHALPPPENFGHAARDKYAPPRNRAEEILSGIWAEILGVGRIGINDNFFRLGGDSIRGIQAIARANRAGIQLTTHQLFQNQTVAQLASVAGSAPVVQAEQGAVVGTALLTPIQHWFFERDLAEPQHFNQSVLLETSEPLDFSLLEQSVRLLSAHHDALRLRFARTESGWQQFHASSDEAAPVSQMTLSASTEEEYRAAIDVAVARLQSTLNLSAGPLARFTLFRSEHGLTERLHIVIHHLAVDGVSWRILLEDLHLCYEQLARGEEVEFAPKTTSYQYWAQRLSDYAQSETLWQEAIYWPSAVGSSRDPLPLDFEQPPESNTLAATEVVSVSLDAAETKALLTHVPQSYQVLVNDVLLTALARSFAKWTHRNSLLICLEGHGRQEIFADVDVSRTVGWFTTHFPVRLSLPGSGEPGSELKAIKEQLRSVPNQGIGYGLLRYLSRNTRIVAELEALPPPEVLFNYFGELDHLLPASTRFSLSPESAGHDRSLTEKCDFLIEINAYVMDGRLVSNWTYSSHLHRRETIEALVDGFLEALRLLVNFCLTGGATGYTPSDFRKSKLSQTELDKLLSKLTATRGNPA